MAQFRPQGTQIGLLVKTRQRLGPGECRLFAIGEIADVAPDDDTIQPLVGFTVVARFFGVHLDAMGAAVHLGGAQMNEMGELAVEAEVMDGVSGARHGLEDVGDFLLEVHRIGGRHGISPSI